jgi:uncharacterized protein (DUF433 family)
VIERENRQAEFLEGYKHELARPDCHRSQILAGKPTIKGTRLAAEFVVDLLAQGWTEDQIVADYPGLTHEDILASLLYGSDLLKSERVFPTPV